MLELDEFAPENSSGEYFDSLGAKPKDPKKGVAESIPVMDC